MARAIVLHVLPNPFAALDSDGDPAAALPRVDLPSLLVGARVDLERSRDGATKFLFDLQRPVQLPDLPAYRSALRSGDLLPADEATARLVGCPFVAPEEALRQARALAAARWRAETGEDPPFAASPPEASPGAVLPGPASPAPSPSSASAPSPPVPSPPVPSTP